MTMSVSQFERIAELVDNSFAVKSIRDNAQKENSNPLEVAGDYGTIANGLASFLDTPGRTMTSSITAPLVLASAIYKFSKGTAGLDNYADIASLIALKTNNVALARIALSFSVGVKIGGYIQTTWGPAIDARIGESSMQVGDYFMEKTGSVEFGSVMAAATHAMMTIAYLPSEFGPVKELSAWIEEQGLLEPAFNAFDHSVAFTAEHIFAPANEAFQSLNAQYDAIVESSNARPNLTQDGAAQDLIKIDITPSPTPQQHIQAKAKPSKTLPTATFKTRQRIISSPLAAF